MIEVLNKEDIASIPGYNNHQRVVRFSDTPTGLVGYVAIHSTALGPAIGGTRMYPFASDNDALEDVLKLSAAMTKKCALAGLPLGGGKCVIIGSPASKTPELLRAYGRAIQEIGQIRTGVDVGMNDADIEIAAEETDFMVGTAKHGVKLSTGDTAALGVYYSVRACLGDPRDKTVVIQGAGKLGAELARLLCKEGARVKISDVDPAAIINLKSQCPEIEQIGVGEAISAECDLLAPCALGGEINRRVIDTIKAKIICGGANNQLAEPGLDQELHNRGILYAPDYVVNAGGLINVADELEPGGYNEERVLQRVKNIGATLSRIIEQSRQDNVSPSTIADRLAEQIISK